MGKITEIEAAIQQLSPGQLEELARWLESYRAQRGPSFSVGDWLIQATGAAKPGVTTAEVMALTRGEE